MLSYRNLPIRQKLMLAIVGSSGTAVLLASIVFMSYEWVSARKAMTNDLTTLAQITGANSTAALSFNDVVAAHETLAALKAKPQIMLACIYVDAGTGDAGSFASYAQAQNTVPCPATAPARGMVFSRSTVTLAAPIKLGSETLGVLYIQRSLDDLWQTTAVYLLIVLGVFLACLVIALALATLLQRFIAEPILSLAYTAARVSETKDYSLRAQKNSDDEVGWLIGSFNEMLVQIGLRDRALEQAQADLQTQVEERSRANTELQQTLVRLQNAQEQLVQTEKMASLGGLVAGVAHEINTPIGIGVTAASTLRVKTVSLSEEYAAGTLTNSGLNRFVDLAMQSTEILLSNLNRASELIQSFKQVAVDQSSSERRRFAIKPYLGEILLSLRPKLKKTHLIVEVHCDDKLEVNSYPGAFAQILTNLVMNSLIHAYDEGQSGTLSINVERRGDKVYLRYADDGRGMPPEHVARVFDPFFTTKRGTGGSGLGMHIVFNLVTQQLGGTVTLQSEVGKGTVIEIVMPAGEESEHAQPRYAAQSRR